MDERVDIPVPAFGPTNSPCEQGPSDTVDGGFGLLIPLLFGLDAHGLSVSGVTRTGSRPGRWFSLVKRVAPPPGKSGGFMG
ncbi:hypothetical protein BanimalisJ1_09590 [Bifidobacterium animalis]|jgi:hypothetical protein|nr:hypothetical protein BanimalisJ1_09590 [Bifidobacterium animalis]